MSRRAQPKKNIPTPTRAKPRPTNTRARLYVVLMMLALGSTALIVRAVDLQVVRKDFYQEQGDARFLREMPIPVSRGTIFDRNGEPLAVSTPVESIWANPQQLLEQSDRLPVLAAALGVDAAALQQKLEQHQDKEFVYLKRQLNPDDADVITKLGIVGVSAQREYKRYYPSGEVLAHILGVTNVDDRGQEGLELAFDDWLAGTPGAEHVIRDNKGHTVEDVELLRDPKPGRDLTLSIDRRIQYMAYRELKGAIIEHHAMSGSIVVLDVQSGEILAMVNQPSFNPNARGNADLSYRRNRAMTDVVEPGSTMKAFTMATALESGKWTLKSHVDTNPGYYQIGTWTIHDVKNHGLLDLTGVITKSSNIGAAKIAETLSRDSLYDMFKRFGFGESTGSGFPGESSGLLPVVTAWGPVEKATISYGYGLNVTPLQLAQGYAALANDGRLRAPTFVKGARNPDNAIIDPEIAHTVVGMLETVVQPGGTAYPQAVVANYLVAGKTGTARMAHAGSYQNKYVSTFVGFVPASAPRLVGVVVIHDAQGGYFGGAVSAPVFSKVMDGALRILDVAPDNVQRWYAGGPAAPIPSAAATDDAAEEVP
ncbi:MAG TPA: penicillin-binding protein 2 [Rudaea sp.]|jgi:cell division protein FtsI (penicillin-binding protein 3)|nr:penicillin-binding protein 2 [Rudaea sp.]